MISDIHNEIDHTDAITMDDVYDSCNSIKKLIETLNYSLSEFAPNLQLYFMIVAFDELFNNEKDETKTLERIFKSLNVNDMDLNVLVSMHTVLHHCNTSNISNYDSFYNTCKNKLYTLGIDIEKIK